jgi:DNA (cytosine-5)-methyltransferase 1
VSRPKLLDLFCCQGGASAGYVAAGFDVVGVDIDPQPRYPFSFFRRDAIEFARRHGRHFAAVHASPPCQAFTNAQRLQGNEHPDLIGPTREVLTGLGLPYVIENVPGSPLIEPAELCGAMFGLGTYRHRLFETNWELATPEHPEHVAKTTKMGRSPVEGEFMHIVGNFSGVARGREVMGMPWANRDGLREAIPPAYTEYIGLQLRAQVDNVRESA